MNLRIPIGELRPGMFVEANVMSLLKDGEIRHFLDPLSAVYAFTTSKRLRLMKRRHEQVATTGGMLIGSSKQAEALRGLGLLEVTINTDKSDVIPNVKELVEEKKQQRRTWVESDEEKSFEWVSDMAGIEELSLESLDDPVSGLTAPGDDNDRRRSFGANRRGWMEVDLSGEADEAVMRVVSFGGDESLSQEDIVRTLQEEYGIREGLDFSAISGLAANAAASPDRTIHGNFVVARGLGRQVPSIGHIDFTFLTGIDDDDLDYEALRLAMASRSITQVTERPIAACLVMPGQELAVFHPAGAEGGHRGPETPPQARELLQAGSFVKLSEDRYTATILGYVCVLQAEISIIPPLWIAPDRMEAHYVRFPSAGPPPLALGESHLVNLFERTYVRFGLQKEAVEELLRETAVEEPNSVLIAEVTPPGQGQPGMDIAGDEIPVTAGEEATLMAGSNVRSEERGGCKLFHAQRDGRVNFKKDVLSVRAVAAIERDVEGRLEVEEGKDVHIRGSIRAGSRVVAGGSLIIDGVVEAGVHIEAADDVIVAKGIIGHDTQVVANGDVSAQFVQSAAVKAAGNVSISDHLMNARVRAGGNLTVRSDAGKERSGSVVGGEVTAGGTIRARRVGSGAAGTTIEIAADARLQAGLYEAIEAAEFSKKNALRILRTLGITDIESAKIRDLIQRVPAENRQSALQLLGQLRDLMRTGKQALKRKAVLEEAQVRQLDQAEIHIEEQIEAQVEIVIGEARRTLPELLPGTVFKRSGKVIESVLHVDGTQPAPGNSGDERTGM